MRFWPARLKPPYRKEGSELWLFLAHNSPKSLSLASTPSLVWNTTDTRVSMLKSLTRKAQIEHSRKRLCCRVSVPHRLKTKALESRSTTQTRRIPHGIPTRPSQWVSRLPRKLLRTTSTTVWHLATLVPSPVRWHTPSRLRPLPSLTMRSPQAQAPAATV